MLWRAQLIGIITRQYQNVCERRNIPGESDMTVMVKVDMLLNSWQSLPGTLARLISYPVERVHHASVAQPG